MPRHAEIAGAGVAGLGLACRLRQLGWTVRVHERAAEVRDGGAAISLGQNGVDPLRLIGALDEALVGGCAVDYWNIMDHRRRVLQEDHVRSELYSIPRSSMLRSVYQRALELGAEVVTGSPVRGYDDHALVLENGNLAGRLRTRGHARVKEFESMDPTAEFMRAMEPLLS